MVDVSATVGSSVHIFVVAKIITSLLSQPTIASVASFPNRAASVLSLTVSGGGFFQQPTTLFTTGALGVTSTCFKILCSSDLMVVIRLGLVAQCTTLFHGNSI